MRVFNFNGFITSTHIDTLYHKGKENKIPYPFFLGATPASFLLKQQPRLSYLVHG